MSTMAGLLLAVMVSAGGPAWGGGIVIRDDRDDTRYLELGAHFEGVAVDLAVPFRDPARTGGNGVGVLVGSRWVLTAAHVAAALQPGHPASRVSGPHSVIVAGKPYRVAEVVLQPRWSFGEGPSPDDIALLRLAEPVEGGDSVAVYDGGDEEGRDIVIVGWGDTGTGLTGPVSADGRLRGATNRIDEAREGEIVFDFDEPESPEATDLEGVSGPGDSGGPALTRVDGRWYVVGVSVAQDGMGRGPGRYGAREFYTRVSRYANWIRSVMSG